MISVYPANGAFVVAADEVWLPGCYATEKAAQTAAQMPPALLQELQNRKKEAAGGTGGVITDADLATAHAATP